MTESSNNMPEPISPASIKEDRRFPLVICLVFSLICLAVALWIWYDSQSLISKVREELGDQVLINTKQGDDNQSQLDALKQQIGLLRETVRQVEAQHNDIRDQQLALADIYRGVLFHEDRRLINDIEHLFMIAHQELQLASNVPSAISTLETADMLLSQADNQAKYMKLRRALASDLEQLKALPEIDVTGTAIKIDALIKSINSSGRNALPLIASQERTEIDPVTDASETAPTKRRWQDFFQGIWDELRQLVTVRTIHHPDAALVSPEQGFFIKENLKLRLLSARAALLSREDSAYHQDLEAALRLLQQYFDQDNARVQAAMQTVIQLNQNHPVIELPDITQSYAALKEISKEEKAISDRPFSTTPSPTLDASQRRGETP